MKAGGEEGPASAPRRAASGETNPTDTVTLDFQPQNREKCHFCCVSLPGSVLRYGSPGTLTQSRYPSI